MAVECADAESLLKLQPIMPDIFFIRCGAGYANRELVQHLRYFLMYPW